MQDLVKLAVAFFTVAWTSASLSRHYSKELGKRAIANVMEHPLFPHSVQGQALQFHCLFQCERDVACRAVNVGKDNTCELVFSPSYTILDDTSFNLLIGDYKCPEGFDHIFQLGTPEPIGKFIPSCYMVKSGPRTREQARAFCDVMGSHLVAIETPEEQTHIVHNLDLSGVSGGIWTSGYSRYLDGHWAWTSSDADMVYTNWGFGEPGNQTGNERCCFLRSDWGLRWSDVPCDAYHNIICEKPVNFGA